MTDKELKWRKSLNKYRATGVLFLVLGLAVAVAVFVGGILMILGVDVIQTRSIMLIFIFGWLLHLILFNVMKKRY